MNETKTQIAKIEILATIISELGIVVLLGVGSNILADALAIKPGLWTIAAVLFGTVAILTTLTMVFFRFQAVLRALVSYVLWGLALLGFLSLLGFVLYLVLTNA
jgi:hypothetical protein